MLKLRNFFTNLGIKSLLSVDLLHESFILIHLSAKEDYTRLLFRALWYVEDTAMKLFKWSPEFNPSEDSPVVPVWLGFSGLPIHFFNRSALFSIAKAVGNPLKSDESTALLTRPSVAWICIEVDISKEWPQRIWIGDEKNGYWQDVFVENPPLFCSQCKMLGHEEKVCYRLHPSILEEINKKKREEEEEAKTRTEKEEAETPKKKKGKAIIVSVGTQVFQPKRGEPLGQSVQPSVVAEHHAVGGDKTEPSPVPPPPAEQTSIPISGITLTPFPDLEKIRRKQTEKSKGKSKLVAEGPPATGNQEKQLLFSPLPIVKSSVAILSSVSDFEKFNQRCVLPTPSDQNVIKIQPLDLTYRGRKPSAIGKNSQQLDLVIQKSLPGNPSEQLRKAGVLAMGADRAASATP